MRSCRRRTAGKPLSPLIRPRSGRCTSGTAENESTSASTSPVIRPSKNGTDLRCSRRYLSRTPCSAGAEKSSGAQGTPKASHQVALRAAAAFLAQPWKGAWSPAVPGVAQPGSGEVPVGTDLARHRPQIVPEVDHRGPAPEPVAVVDAVNDEPGRRAPACAGSWDRARGRCTPGSRGPAGRCGPGRRGRSTERRPTRGTPEARGGHRWRSWPSACRPRRSSDRTRRARGAADAPWGSSDRARASGSGGRRPAAR